MSSKPDAELPISFGDIPDPAETTPARAPLRAPTLDAPVESRTISRQKRWLALLASALWYLGHLAVYGVRPDLHALPWLYQAMQISLPLLLALASLWLSLSPGRLGLGAKVELLSALAVVGPLSFWAVAVGAPQPRTPDPETLIDTFVCFDITLAWAAVPLLCAVVSLRRAFPSASLWRSALLGSACGLFAAGIMNLHCANVSRVHLFAGHGLPVVIAAVVGAWLVRRVARA